MTEPLAQPLVTIGVPVFNGGALLERALLSISGQSYRNLEIVISDNESTDRTADIIRAHVARDSRVRCFRQAERVPVLVNFKFVLDHSQGRYFFWAPHDDWWNPRYIELGVAALEQNPGASAVMGTVRYFNAREEEILRYDPPYPLSDHCVYRRIRKYLTNVVTDHLFYAMFRRDVLLDSIWSRSTTPEKVVIMHALMKGPIVDGWGMEYYNRYIPKTLDEIAGMHALPSARYEYQARVFADVVQEIWRGTSLFNAMRLVPLYFFSQSWHKFFAKWLLGKIGFKLG